MAIFHLSAQMIKRSSGRSCVAAAAYRAGECLQNIREDREADFSRKREVEHSEILAPKKAPEWASDREQLWNEVDAAEKRKDAQTAREINMALPRELDLDQQVHLMRSFCESELVSKGMVADFSIHKDKKNHNPHAHIMLTTRTISKDGFGKKERSWNDKSVLEDWREKWAEFSNVALERFGHKERISHKSNKARGLTAEPTIHIGPAAFHAPERRRSKFKSKALQRQSQYGRKRKVHYHTHDFKDRREHNARIQARNAERSRQKAAGGRQEVSPIQKTKERNKAIRDALAKHEDYFDRKYGNPRRAMAAFAGYARAKNVGAATRLLFRKPKRFGELERDKKTRQADKAATKRNVENRLEKTIGKTKQGKDAKAKAQKHFEDKDAAAKAEKHWKETGLTEIEKKRLQANIELEAQGKAEWVGGYNFKKVEKKKKKSKTWGQLQAENQPQPEKPKAKAKGFNPWKRNQGKGQDKDQEYEPD